MITRALAVNLDLLDKAFDSRTVSSPGSVGEGSGAAGAQQSTRQAEYFRELCKIYQSLILNNFAYSSDSIPFMTMTFRLLPKLVERLRTGSVRYLSDTLPFLCTSISGTSAQRELGSLVLTKSVLEMRIAAVRATCSLVRACRGTGRIDRWRGAILAAAASFTVLLKDIEPAKRNLAREKAAGEAIEELLRALVKDGDESARVSQTYTSTSRHLHQSKHRLKGFLNRARRGLAACRKI